MKRSTPFVLTIVALVAFAWLTQAVPATAQGTLFVQNDKVGIGEAAPQFPLDVVGTIQMKKTDSSTATMSFKVSGPSTNQQWIFFNNGVNGNFEIFNGTNPATPFTIEAGAPAQLMRLTAAGQVKVKGVTVHADYLFEPDYQLPSIEEHAEYMWAQKHLPAVGPGTYDEAGEPYIDLAGSSAGMLEELEKAHIYIEQLHNRLKLREGQIDDLVDRISALESQVQ